MEPIPYDNANILYEKSSKEIKKYIKNGFNINKKCRFYQTTFIAICCRYRNIEKLKLALKLGANSNLTSMYVRTKYNNIHKSEDGVPILHHAISELFIKGVKLLLKYGADIYLKANGPNSIIFSRNVYIFFNVKKQTPCKCDKPDRYACEPCDSKTIYHLIQNHHKKQITLFRIMLKKTHILSE